MTPAQLHAFLECKRLVLHELYVIVGLVGVIAVMATWQLAVWYTRQTRGRQ